MADLPPEEQVVPATITCPGCGVAVAVGYPKCPRCHARVPQGSHAKRQTFREEMIAGGTSLEPPVEPPRIWPWLLAAALMIGGVVAWVASRDGDGKKPETSDVDVASDDDDEDETAAGDEDDDEISAKPGENQPAQPDPADLGSAVRDLDATLRKGRLWAKVSVDGDVVVIESAQCGDSAIGPVVDEHAAALETAGATSVRCQEPHGAVVFDRGL